MRCFPSGVSKTMTWKAVAAVTLVARGYAPLLASLLSVPLSPLESIDWNYKALPHPGQTAKMLCWREEWWWRWGGRGMWRGLLTSCSLLPDESWSWHPWISFSVSFWEFFIGTCTTWCALAFEGSKGADFRLPMVWFYFGHKQKSMSKKK